MLNIESVITSQNFFRFPQEVPMPELPIKFPNDSAHRDYDVFEELPDGSTIWRDCVFGMANVEYKLREMAFGSPNKFFALNLQDRTRPVIRRSDPGRGKQALG